MGVLTRYLAPRDTGTGRSLEASATPLATGWWPASLAWPQLEALDVATRSQAMQVPAVARARNVLAGAIAELPLEARLPGGATLRNGPGWIKQPDPHTPRAVTLAWTVDDLLFEGVAYWQVLEVYAEDGRPRAMQRVHPARVSPLIGEDGWTVRGLQLDGRTVPTRGVGRLVMFQALDEGLLVRAGRTILTALALERASRRYADEPLPASVLKNKGANLPSPKVDELLERWRTARRDGSVGYLNADIDLERVGWSAGELQLVEARQHLAVELARHCNVPTWAIDADSGGSLTYSNTTEQRRSLVDYSLRPFLAAIEGRLAMADVTAAPVEPRLSLDEFLRGSPKDRAEVLEILTRADVLTPDEAREHEGLSPRGSTDPDPDPDDDEDDQ